MEGVNMKYKVTNKAGKVYISVMFWYPRGRDERNSTCSRSQIDNLHYLLSKLDKEDYRKFAEVTNIHTGRSIISEYIKGVNHRIDHQTRVNPDDPMLNLAYQIDKNSHAGVQIFVKPMIAPNELIAGPDHPKIYDRNFGFNDEQVNEFFTTAIEHSARNQCHCEIRWFIIGVEKKEEKEETQEKRKARISMMVAEKIGVLLAESKKGGVKVSETKKAEIKGRWKKGTKRLTIFTLKHRPLPAYMTGIKIAGKVTEIGIKVGVKELTKAGIKIGAKESTKFGGKSIAKKIPIVGLAAGCAFGIFRMTQGDFLGAAMEVSSGAVSLIPGYGTAASLAIDAGLVAYDLAS